MSDLTAVSLFAGIGGIDLALKRAGVSVKAAVEIDEDCRAKLRQHFPESRLFNDVTEVTGGQLRAAGFVPERGIITGGFPCQDLSVAGRRTGLGGARSGLFWHIMRLADDLRPRWLLLENVPGLLSAVCPCPGDGGCVDNGRAVQCGEWRNVPEYPEDDGEPDCPVCRHEWGLHDAGGFCSPCQDTCEGLPEVRFRKVFFPFVAHSIKGGACRDGCMPAHGGAMGTVLGALGQRGYGFAYRVLDAQHFGVPQRRRRVFIAGCLGDAAGPVEVLLEPEGGNGHPAAGGQARARVAGTLAASAGGGSLGGAGQSVNSITSRLVEVASALQGGGRRGHRIDAEGAAGGHLIAQTITAREGKGPDSDATNGNDVAVRGVPIALRGRGDSSQIEFGGDDEPAFAKRTPAGGGSYPMVATFGGEGVRGGAVTLTGDITHTLTSGGHDSGEDGTGRSTPIVAIPLRETGGRIGSADDPSKEGCDVGTPGDPSYTLRTGGTPHGVMVTSLAVAGDFSSSADRAQTVRSAHGQPGVIAVGFAENQRGELVESAVSHQLTTGGGKPGQGFLADRQEALVRRLTPLECERLQGFPDGWTDGQSDATRYRQLGNSVAVPCVEWITRRIADVEARLTAAEEVA